MNHVVSRRQILGTLGSALGWLLGQPAAQAAKDTVQKVLAHGKAPKGYDPYAHKWLMCVDVDRCIGCGLCVDACKTENHVPEAASYFRTWVERYIIKKPAPGGEASRGAVQVDSPNGGRQGFPPSLVPRAEILKSFFVPKLCNLCEHSPCAQACPVGATFDSPDGAVLVDPTYCIGCGFCIQACPYGCRFMNPITKTADKCSLCYRRDLVVWGQRERGLKGWLYRMMTLGVNDLSPAALSSSASKGQQPQRRPNPPLRPRTRRRSARRSALGPFSGREISG